MKSIDKAIKVADSIDGVDIKHIAEYFWQWEDGDVASDIKTYLERKAPKNIKTREEFNQWAKNQYSSALDSVYADLKREINRMLESGYKATYNRLKSSYNK